MKKQRQPFEDRFDRKAKAQSRMEFRQKMEKQNHKYFVDIDDVDNKALTGVMPFYSKHKGN